MALDTSPGAGVGAVASPSALLHIRGATVTVEQWASASVNQTVGAERAVPPLALGGYYGRKLFALDRPSAWLDADPARDISMDEALRTVGASAEAIRLIDANMNGNSLAGLSQLSAARTTAVYRAGPGPTMTVRGGSQRLPEAMARALASPVRLRMAVTAIREDAGRVTVMTTHGSLIARHVICTIPFAALRHLSVEAVLPVPLAAMIGGLPYTRATFAFLSAARPFWRDDGHPDTLWTDDPLIGRVFVASDDPPVLKLWTFGDGADQLDRMSHAQAAAAIIPRIEAMRPAARGLLKLERLFSWQRRPGARGIYHHIGTGQAAMLAAATRHRGRSLHFAGEHLGQAATGMEAALESADRVARALIADS